jgi:hypothetical protein
VSSIALPAPPAGLLGDLLALSASVRAAWTRPPKSSAAEIADEVRDTLRVIENATVALIRNEAKVRDNLAAIHSLHEDADAVPREMIATFAADVETMLATFLTEIPEGTPFERLLKNVVEPYNDAVRRCRRAMHDYHAELGMLLAAIDARDATDARLARAVVDDQTDAVVPWQSTRDNVRKIR